jgi:hypothetical protein
MSESNSLVRVKRIGTGLAFNIFPLVTQFADGPILADEPLWFTGRLLQAVLLSAVILGALAENKRLQALSPIGLLLFLAFVSITRLWTPGVIE